MIAKGVKLPVFATRVDPFGQAFQKCRINFLPHKTLVQYRPVYGHRDGFTQAVETLESRLGCLVSTKETGLVLARVCNA